jgi:hypothetical protein
MCTEKCFYGQRSFKLHREASMCAEKHPFVWRRSKVCREAIMGYNDTSRFTLKLSNAQKSFDNA